VIFHFYQVSVPQWESFVLTISIQGVVIVFGIFVYLFGLNHYCGLPGLAALIVVINGVPTSMIWQYLPPHCNPIPQAANDKNSSNVDVDTFLDYYLNMPPAFGKEVHPA
jgi:hypothetical protein